MRWFSRSELWAFKRCRRRWWFQYWRRLARRREGPSAASLGRRVHLWMERFYADGEEAAWAALDELTAQERRRWENWSEWAEASGQAVPSWEEWQKEAALARIMLEGYVEQVVEQGADAGYEVVGVERDVRVPVTEEWGLIGKLDLKVREPTLGRVLFRDHKTVQDFSRVEATLALNEQLLHYQLLERLDSGEVVPGAELNMLRKVKRTARATPPFYKRTAVHHSEDELRAYWRRTMGTVRDLRRVEGALAAGEDPLYHAYPTPEASCFWQCPYFTACPMADDPASDLEGYLAEQFEEADPLERYAEDEEGP